MIACQDTPQKRRQQRLQAAGLCTICGKAESHGKARCRPCAERVLAKRRKGWKCEVCGEQVMHGKRRCLAHPANQLETKHKLKQRRMAAGLCVWCGSQPACSGRQTCDPCAERRSTANREAYRALRRRVIAEYGGKCVCCGETEIDFLTLDHINNDGHAQRRVTPGGAATYKRAHREKPKDLQVLCYNCNCAKGHYGICPHVRALTGEPRGIRILRRRHEHSSSNTHAS